MTEVPALVAPRGPEAAGGAAGYRPNVVVPLPRTGRRVGAAILGALLALLAWDVATNPRYGWGIVLQYLFAPAILRGLALTIGLTAVAMVLGSLIGLGLALMRLSESRIFRTVSGAFVWFFRGTPLLVLLIIFYNISYLYPKVTLGIPFGPQFLALNVNAIITPTVAAIVVFSLNEAAFMCEIFRGGLLSVSRGQSEAAQVLGMHHALLMRRIVIPQAMRFVMPPAGNQVISLLKATSLVSVVSSADLLYSAQTIYAETYQTVPLLIVTALWYLALTSVLTVAQRAVERRYGRGATTIGGLR